LIPKAINAARTGAKPQRLLRNPLLAMLILVPLAAACNPTVKVEAPDKPIVINLNVKIEQEVRVKIDKDVDSLVKSNPNLF
jgi:hypothetical protein